MTTSDELRDLVPDYDTLANKDNVRKWVEALESGEYLQGRGALRVTWTAGSKVEYCCLGVACDVYRKETGLGEWNENDQFITPDARPVGGLMPIPVRDWLGFTSTDPVIGVAGRENGESIKGVVLATAANDVGGYSFGKIASLVRAAYLEGGDSDGSEE